jgi:Uncharacterized conserved protein
MILVTLGTQDKPFVRLLEALEKAKTEGIIKDDIVVQAGYTKYSSKVMKIFDFVTMDKFDKLVSECDVLITHGGVGSIISGLNSKKKIIAIARLKKYGEHTNDHQKQIIKKFVKDGYILELKNLNKIDEVLNEVKKLKSKKYNSNTENMVNLIETFIENN